MLPMMLPATDFNLSMVAAIGSKLLILLVGAQGLEPWTR
jgi:hypothetical protein